MTFSEKVYSIIRTIPRGKVASYGQIAQALGSPRASRAVGRVLHVNPDPENIPCHRVVNKYGRLAPEFAFGGPREQQHLLELEGIEVVDGMVDMSLYDVDYLQEPAFDDEP